MGAWGAAQGRESREVGKQEGPKMKIGNLRIDIHGIGGLIILAVVIVVAWWVLGAILSMTVGHLLLLIAAGGIGYVIGRGRR
jgi:hypothetical protein